MSQPLPSGPYKVVGSSRPDPGDRLPPQNLEAERSVLGSVLLDGTVLADVLSILDVADFYRDAHQIIYRVMREMHHQDKPIDSVTLPDELVLHGQFEKIGGDDTLREIIESVPHQVNAKYYAGIVRERSIARQTIDVANDALRDAYSHEFTGPELRERMFGRVEGIAAEQGLASYKPKTFGEIARAMGELRHLWQDWLVIGSLSMVYSKPKYGKTRVYLALAKYLWYAQRWPDGAINEWPAGTKTLVLPYDRNHAEIAAEMKLSGIPDEAVVCASDPRDPTGLSLLSLTDPLMIAILEKTLGDDKAIKLVVIDTLTYASSKNLCKPEDMKELLDSVMMLAARYAVAVLVLIHENKEGEALGRRINERARVLMRLERYNETDPTRLRLSVKDSNFKTRPALTAVHTDTGVTLEKDQGPAGITSDRRDACARWIVDFFFERGGAGTEADFGALIDAAGTAGFAGTFNPVEKRWGDRQTFSRAVKAINDQDAAIKDLHPFKLSREERVQGGRSKPLIIYRLENRQEAGAPF